QILKQLQGYEIPAAAWESDILPRRIARYTPELLDRLCLSGEVMWGRVSSPRSFQTETDTAGRRVRPTRVAPVGIFLRDDASWLLDRTLDSDAREDQSSVLSYPAREVANALRSRGASFLPELVRATGRLPSEVEDALWELATVGLVTADG